MIYVLLLVVPFIIDRITKLLALAYLHQPIMLMPGITLTLVKNRGISWGLLCSNNSFLFIMTTIAICIITALLLTITYKTWLESKAIIGNLLVISGAVANIIDRMWYAGVIDFIELSYKEYAFPVFNVADCAIVVGAAFMFYYYWKYE